MRSYYYSDSSKEYTNTTRYESEESHLDIGYQKLKKIEYNIYPYFSQLGSIFLDHNLLRELPSPSLLPNLKNLSCSYNLLEIIPFYPQLKYLNISHNKIKSIDNYSESSLRYLDCEGNIDININIMLPKCKKIFCSETKQVEIQMHNYPMLELLDCSHNKIINFSGNNNLVELDIQDNQVSVLPKMPYVTHIFADNNQLKHIETYPMLKCLAVSNNAIESINTQPNLVRLFASSNKLTGIESMPMIKYLDISHNHVKNITITSEKIKIIKLQFNNIERLCLDLNKLISLSEIKIDHQSFHKIECIGECHSAHVDIYPCDQRLDKLLSPLTINFLPETVDLIKNQLMYIDYYQRRKQLFDLATKLCELLHVSSNDNECKRIHRVIKKLYLSSIFITITFA